MEFISTKGMTNETAPDGQVLVRYLEPFMGAFAVEYTIAYFDNPNSYLDGNGEGWLTWVGDHKINVLSYFKLPNIGNITNITQKEFLDIYGCNFPNLGSIGE